MKGSFPVKVAVEVRGRDLTRFSPPLLVTEARVERDFEHVGVITLNLGAVTLQMDPATAVLLGQHLRFQGSQEERT